MHSADHQTAGPQFVEKPGNVLIRGVCCDRIPDAQGSDRRFASALDQRTFDIAAGWRGGHPIDVPIFVVTHQAPTEGEWSPRVSFVTEGVERAVELAKDAAGGRDVSVCAANTAQQLLRAGLLDEIELSVVPCLLGAGVRLLDHLGPEPIDLEQILVIPSDGVTHLRYRVVRS